MVTSLGPLHSSSRHGKLILLSIFSHAVPPISERAMSAEARLVELKLDLPPAPKAMGVYKPVVIVGNMAYVSGHGPLKSDGSLYTGKLGPEVDQAFATQAARQTGL